MTILPNTFAAPQDGRRYLPNPELLGRMADRDRTVRAHEQAHFAAGREHVRGGIEYTYQIGPDGRLYAVGGHVNIDLQEPDDPEECLEKMEIVALSAMAPTTVGDTLSQEDQQVLSRARACQEKARAKLETRRREDAERAPVVVRA